MTFEELLDQLLEENAKKQIENINAFIDRMVVMELHPKVVEELDELNQKYGETCFTIASGYKDFNTQFNVRKKEEKWLVVEEDFGLACEIEYDPSFGDKPAVEQVETCLSKLKEQIKLLDAVSRNTDTDKWDIEY